MANEILKIQKNHFSHDKEAHIESDMKDLEKHLDKVEKEIKQKHKVKQKKEAPPIEYADINSAGGRP